MSPLKTLLAGVTVSAGCLVLVAMSAAAPTVSCTTRGLVPHTTGDHAVMSVTTVSAIGIGCEKALAVARSVAAEVELGKPISMSGPADFTMSQTTSCAGCATQTHLTISYPGGGVVEIGLKGSGANATTSPAPFPALPSVPGLPKDFWKSFPNLPKGFWSSLPGFSNGFSGIPGFPKLPNMTVPGGSSPGKTTVTL